MHVDSETSAAIEQALQRSMEQREQRLLSQLRIAWWASRAAAGNRAPYVAASLTVGGAAGVVATVLQEQPLSYRIGFALLTFQIVAHLLVRYLPPVRSVARFLAENGIDTDQVSVATLEPVMYRSVQDLARWGVFARHLNTLHPHGLPHRHPST